MTNRAHPVAAQKKGPAPQPPAEHGPFPGSNPGHPTRARSGEASAVPRSQCGRVSASAGLPVRTAALTRTRAHSTARPHSLARTHSLTLLARSHSLALVARSRVRTGPLAPGAAHLLPAVMAGAAVAIARTRVGGVIAGVSRLIALGSRATRLSLPGRGRSSGPLLGVRRPGPGHSPGECDCRCQNAAKKCFTKHDVLHIQKPGGQREMRFWPLNEPIKACGS